MTERRVEEPCNITVFYADRRVDVFFGRVVRHGHGLLVISPFGHPTVGDYVYVDLADVESWTEHHIGGAGAASAAQ